jgi:hypothetical protein
MFCEFPTAARISRRSMLEHLADSEAIYFSSHFPFTSVGQVTQHEGAYEWKFFKSAFPRTSADDGLNSFVKHREAFLQD